MEAVPQRIMMAVLENGKCPLQEWLSSIRDTVTRARITRQIDKLGRGNLGVRRGVGDSLSELKLDFGPGYRVYYAQVGSVIVVLLGGGDKSDQTADISKAQALWRRLENDGLTDDSLEPWQQDEIGTTVTEGIPNKLKSRRKKKTNEVKEL